MPEVIGTNTSGIGVSGTGSSYGVYGTSTGNFAGVVGQNGANGTAPGVYAQTQSTAPGLFAISGETALVDAFTSTSLDSAASSYAATYPNMAGIFVGSVTITGDFKQGVNSGSAVTFAGSASVGGPLSVAGKLTGANAVFRGGSGTGVHGFNGPGGNTTPKYGCGVWGESEQGYGVYGASKTASGVYGICHSGGLAGEFHGNVSVSGHIQVAGITASQNVTVTGNLTAADVILSGADCAEEFDVRCGDPIEPGSVVVFDADGMLGPCDAPYNKAVAGVISGAGVFRPGVILDRRTTGRPRAPLALVGKAYCKADASYGPIGVGDLLTTSATRGHAMKAQDPAKSFGAIIGKALAPLLAGTGLIPVLITLG